MTHASLFTGIGGFDLAAEWMGWDNQFQCEWDPFCQKILSYYWPSVKKYQNIDDADFTIWRGKVDVLSGGFPCQPYSNAGKRKGKDDERHKWPQMLRAIREIRPTWVVGENVRGLVNWNGGMVFDEIQADLETEGYEVFPVILPACGVNAPHRRDRIWFIAHANSDGHGEGFKQTGKKTGGVKKEKQWQERNKTIGQRNRDNSQRINAKRTTSNATSKRYSREKHGEKTAEKFTKNDSRCRWQNFPTQSPVCGRNDGLPRKLYGITFSKWRNESIKAFGNAVVPQVVYQIFQAIAAYKKQ